MVSFKHNIKREKQKVFILLLFDELLVLCRAGLFHV